jgi:uncharacterized damage-inducible protein DinB
VRKMILVSFVAAAVCSPSAQTPPANPLSAGATRSYGIIKNYLLKTTAKVPEQHYSFKPAPEVRSFGEIVGHLADANYGICAVAAGEKPPAGGFEPATSIEKTKKTKTDLDKALADSFEYCDKVHGAMTDTAGAATVKFFTGEMPKLSILEFNTHHEFEHYGNLVTYMRMKGIVPPSSEPRTGG